MRGFELFYLFNSKNTVFNNNIEQFDNYGKFLTTSKKKLIYLQNLWNTRDAAYITQSMPKNTR